jgi:hypothetical protein
LKPCACSAGTLLSEDVLVGPNSAGPPPLPEPPTQKKGDFFFWGGGGGRRDEGRWRFVGEWESLAAASGEGGRQFSAMV